MKVLMLLAMCLAISACAQPAKGPDASDEVNLNTYRAPLRTVHDAKHHVTCWYVVGGYSNASPALSCLPDKYVFAPDVANGR